jgi:hypothetical protein
MEMQSRADARNLERSGSNMGAESAIWDQKITEEASLLVAFLLASIRFLRINLSYPVNLPQPARSSPSARPPRLDPVNFSVLVGCPTAFRKSRIGAASDPPSLTFESG